MSQVTIKEQGLVEIIDNIRKHLRPRWHVYLISLSIFIAAAFVYLHYANNVYQITAKILIKSGNKQSDQISALLNPDDNDPEIENEIEIIKSQSVFEDAIIHSNACISLYRVGSVKKLELTNDFPIKFIPLNYDSLKGDFVGKLGFQDSYSNFTINERKYELTNNSICVLPNGDSVKVFVNKTRLKNNIKKEDKFLIKVSSLSKKYNEWISHFDVKPLSGNSNIVVLNFKTENKFNGVQFLNALINSYERNNLKDQRSITQYTLDFINDRLLLISNELDSVEINLESFKKANSIVDISEQGKVYLGEVQTNDALLNEILIKLSVIDEIEMHLKSELNNSQPPSLIGIDDPVLQENLNKLFEIELEFIKQKQLSGTNEESVDILNKQINNLKANIESSVHRYKANLLIARNKIEQSIARNEITLKGIPQKERLLINITRQQAIKNSIYTYLLEKREETAIAFASTITNSKIIEKPTLNAMPVSPKRLNTFLLFILASLLIPFLYYLITEQFSSKIQFKEDITSVSSLPIIGEILFDKQASEQGQLDFTRSSIGESLRTIRTKVNYFLYDNKKTILVSSSIPGEGKSFFSMNLALVYALANKNTCLVSADLRKPTLHKRLNIDATIGLSNFLVSSMDVEDIIYKTSYPNLSFIPVGNIPPNPAELLQNERFKNLLISLKEKFDVIILDTPPLGLVGDAEIILPYVDLSLLIIRQNFSHKEIFKEVVNSFTDEKVSGSKALIFNGIIPKFKAGYRSKYGYKYGYKYGGYRYGKY
ncbi:MAG: polysaccharide biosynthesis tyrosine autokinase [Chitinophagales bacterium]|nr:polysaccharide biosynthesis tyrosine autokinase [Chitinophagales bacterium]